MSLKSFSGFRGVALMANVDGISFVIIAPSEAQLEVIYKQLMPEDAEPFSPEMCKKSVMIQAALLPEPKTT